MQIQADYNKYNSNVSFGRLSNKPFTTTPVVQKADDYASTIASYLGLNTEKVLTRIKGLNKERLNFLERLAKKYSDFNFNLDGNLKEDSTLVFTALEKIEQPQNYHYEVVSNFSGKFEYISRIFSAAQDKKSMEFALNFQNEILKQNPSCKNMLIEILNSQFKQQYIKNIDDYKSYIILNRENPEAIKELDLLLENNIYDRSVYDIRLAVKEVLNHAKLSSSKYLSQDNIEKYYSVYGTEFLNNFINEYHGIRNFPFSTKSEIDTLEMYKSTTKNNLKTRLGIISKFKSAFVDNSEKTETEISAMRKLFELIDSDKHAKKFVDKFIKNGNISSIQELNEVLTELTPKKANIFSDNIFRIFKRVKGEELIPTLKENYNNPFFETEASRYNHQQMVEYDFRKQSRLSKIKTKALNWLNEMRYNYSEPKIKTFEPIVRVSEPHKIILKSVEHQQETKIPSIYDLLRTQEQDVLPILKHTITTPNGEPAIKVVNTVKDSPKARKLRLIGEVNEFISKKLSAKTIEEQGLDYNKKATKMRLKMLPEIFASIKETRQADRLAGNKKPKSSNKDAVDLYKLIKGNNRKYIKYLLEQRNVDGTRTFEVKDIISMIEEANKEIYAMKKANPDFKAKDAKAYFDHLYEAKVEQYGKVKKPKKK